MTPTMILLYKEIIQAWFNYIRLSYARNCMGKYLLVKAEQNIFILMINNNDLFKTKNKKKNTNLTSFCKAFSSFSFFF